MTKTERNENLVSEHKDSTGTTFSGIIWVIMVIALIMSAGYAVWINI
jgi:hypothetical protein